MGACDHKHVLKFINFGCDWYIKPGKEKREVLFIAMEITEGNLFDFIAESRVFSEPFARYYFR